MNEDKKKINVRICELDCRNQPIFDAYMTLMGVLALPLEREQDNHANLIGSLSQLYYANRAVNDPEWANHYHLMKPAHVFLNDIVVKRSLLTFTRRINDRMAASVIGLEYIRRSIKANAQGAEKLPRWSLNAACQWFCETMGNADEQNVEGRIWRASLPVLHMSCALNKFVEKRMKPDRKKNAHQVEYPMLQAISTIEQLKELVALSNECAHWLINSKDITIGQEKLIQFSVLD